MSKLYNELAWLYHEMYQKIFDYQNEYMRFNSILKEFNCKSILEVGCGSGNSAKYFIDEGYEYKGLDLSDEMLNIARKLNPDFDFSIGDMRNLPFESEFDSIVISGRSFCYMTTNQDVLNCLTSINKSLKSNGILIFDNFEAKQIMQDFRTTKVKIREQKIDKYRRLSKSYSNMETGWTWDWHAEYFILEDGEERKLAEDNSILRAFTKDELELFLELTGFSIIKSINDNPSIYFIAQK